MIKHDEIESLVRGMSFVLNYAKNPAFTFTYKDGNRHM
jgi:hypothetical protein